VVSVERHVWKYPDGQVIDTDILGYDAPPCPGDSGAPVVNDRGELVGLHICGTYESARSGATSGAVIAELLRPAVPPRKSDGKLAVKGR
jgi:S1-C subfamily serine protease